MALLLQSATTLPDGGVVVTVRGEIDQQTAAQLWRYLSHLIGQGHHHIVLDLRSIGVVDAAGFDVIARASAWTRRKDGDLVLRSSSPALAKRLQLARLSQARRSHPSAGG
jgi:anti-anti-sigma factor